MSEAAETTTAAAMVSEARRLVQRGWCQGAHARDADGLEVPSWSEEARSWSLLGALLASWHRQDSQNGDVVAHLIDAHALGRATKVVGVVLGTDSLQQWNDEPQRSHVEVVDRLERALKLLAD